MVECFWLPLKFGYERRKAHLSSLILSNQMTREEALERVKTSELDENTMMQDFEYIAKKLDLTVAEFKALFDGVNKTYRDYKNKMGLITLGTRVMRLLGLEKRVIR